MKKLIHLIILCFVVHNIQGQKKMCISVDDLPVVSYGIDEDNFLRAVTDSLTTNFAAFQVPAIGYVNEKKMYKINGAVDQMKVDLLKMWLEAGCDLGNHSYSHANYHQIPWDEYKTEVITGGKISKPLVQQYGKEYKFFRHPYLRSGQDSASAARLNEILNQNGYKEAPVTIDNDDYLFAVAYHRAYVVGNTERMAKIGAAYISYMEQKVVYFENLSMALFGRHIDQTLIIHASLLNAHYIHDLIQMIQRYDYQFASQEEVLKDPGYEHKVTKFGNWGISWLERWAISEGGFSHLFKEDPAVPEFISE